MKNIEKALAIGMAVCVGLAAWHIPFARNCAELREDTLRLHVVANSDSEADQAVKLLVRDALLTHCSEFLEGAGTRDEAALLAGMRAAQIEQLAADVLAEQGFEYGVKATVTEMYFEQRSYGEVTLPAGIYTALRIELGAAEGHNWWCVIFPALCIPTASGDVSEDEDALDGYTDEERDLVTGEPRYEFRFKLEEWLQQLFG